MGKSLGNVLDPQALVGAYGPDAVRFFFMREIAFGSDGDFSEGRFQDTINASLANGLGNLLNRTLTMLWKNAPAESGQPLRLARGAAQVRGATRLAGAAERAAQAAQAAYEDLCLHQACEAAVGLIADANLLLSELQPWHTFKKARQRTAGGMRVGVSSGWTGASRS